MSSTPSPGPCRVTETITGRFTRTVVLENDLISCSILADKGADIFELRYKPRDLDVLWKAPWGFKEIGSFAPSAMASEVAWMDHYEGGWQEIFPSGGGPATYQGVEMPFHGEVSTVSWDYEILENTPERCRVWFTVATTRTPFRLERTMTIEAGRADILFEEKLTNEGAQSLDYMWGHHPAFGAPFFSDRCRLDGPAANFVANPTQTDPERSWLPDGASFTWPTIVDRSGKERDLSRIPGPEEQVNNMGYLVDLDEGWYGLTNQELGVGIGLVWPKEFFPCVWLWQELHGSLGYPWYGRVYVMGIEIWTSWPGLGLNAVQSAGTARQIGARESESVSFRAVFYESAIGVERIDPDGTVSEREE
jgi:galactose mutarotase-like enzyme